MNVLLEILRIIIPLIVTLVFAVSLLFVLLISVVYIVGYIYDSIVGDSLIKLGHYISKKYPKIKSNSIVIKLWRKIQPKKLYLRYETPLFAYCFSYTAISVLALVFPIENGIGSIYASGLYLLSYFLGMARRCGSNEQYYKKVLDNNMEFLKLSFLPLGFIITVLGFFFTITGLKLQDIPFDDAILESIIYNFVNFSEETNIFKLFLKMIASGGLVFIMFYTVSLPIQVISYFVVSVINYIRKHKEGYSGLLKKYLCIVVYLIKSLF